MELAGSDVVLSRGASLALSTRHSFYSDWPGKDGDVFGVSEDQVEQSIGASGCGAPGTASEPVESADSDEANVDTDEEEVETIPIGVPTSTETWRELKRRADEPD
jgi:hypothetical protein